MSSEKIKTQCPRCNAALRVWERAIGSRLRCLVCGDSFVAVRSQDETLADQTASPTIEPSSNAAKRSSPKASSPQSDQTTIGRFRLEQKLGEGGFGAVFKAYDPQLDRFVAIKVPTFGLGDKRRSRRFVTEARSAARLHHPNIVAVYENGQTNDGRLYIASEFVDGRTLKQKIEAAESTIEQRVRWVRDLADALAYAHDEGIVHRDIKPDNVLIDFEHERARVADFGLAKVVNDSVAGKDAPLQTQDGVLGTPAFMAPEQARGQLSEVGPHSDQYSLGAVLYQCLTGKPPFSGSTYMVIAAVAGDQLPPVIHQLAAHVPRDLIAICEKAMHKDVAGRYVNTAGFREDLDRWLRGETVQARPTSIPVKVARWCRRNPGIASLTGLLAVVICTATALLLIAYSRTTTAKEVAVAEAAKAESALREMTKAKEDLENANVSLDKARLEAEESARIAVENEELANDARDLADDAKGEAEAALAKLEQQIEATDMANKGRATAEAGRKFAQLSNLVQKAYNDFYIGQSLLSREPAHGLLWLAKALEAIESEPEQTQQMTQFVKLVRTTMAPEIARLGLLLKTQTVGDDLSDSRRIAFSDNATQVATVSGDRLAVYSTDAPAPLYEASISPNLQATSATSRYQKISGDTSSAVCNQICFVGNGGRVAILSGEMREFEEVNLFRGAQEPRFVGVNSNVRVHAFANLKTPIITPMAYQSSKAVIWDAGFCTESTLYFAAIFRSELGIETSQVMSWNGSGAPRLGPVIDVPIPVTAIRSLRRRGELLVAVGAAIRVFRLPSGPSWGSPALDVIECNDRVVDLRVSADEMRVAAILQNGQVMLFDTQEYLATLLNHGRRKVQDAVFSGDGRFLLTGCEDRLARVWECDTGLLRNLPLLHKGEVLATAARGNQVLTVCSDGKLRTWQLPTASPSVVLPCAKPKHVAVSPQSRLVLLAKEAEQRGAPAEIKLCDPQSGVSVHQTHPNLKLDGIVAVQFASEAQAIVIATQRALSFVSASDLREVRSSLPLVSTMPNDVKLSGLSAAEDLSRIGFILTDGSAYIRDLAAERALRKLPFLNATSVATSADGQFVAIGTEFGEINIVDAASGKVIGKEKISEAAIRCSQFSPAGDQLAVSTFPSGLLVLNRESLTADVVCRHPPEDHVQNLRYLKGGAEIAAISANAIRAWDLETELQTLFRLRNGSDTPCDISPDGQFAVEGNVVQTPKLTADGSAADIKSNLESRSGLRLTTGGVLQFVEAGN